MVERAEALARGAKTLQSPNELCLLYACVCNCVVRVVVFVKKDQGRIDVLFASWMDGRTRMIECMKLEVKLARQWSSVTHGRVS